MEGQKQPLGFEVFGSRVLIRQEIHRKTEGGIELPEAHLDYKPYGEVVAVGEAVKYLKVGDKVRFIHMAAADIELNGEQYLVLVEDEIIGKYGRNTCEEPTRLEVVRGTSGANWGKP